MQLNLANANKPIEVIPLGINWWGYKVYVAKDDWIMAVDADNHQLCLLSCYYNIQWKECPCMKDVRLEDVTPELSNKAYEEIKHVDY